MMVMVMMVSVMMLMDHDFLDDDENTIQYKNMMMPDDGTFYA